MVVPHLNRLGSCADTVDSRRDSECAYCETSDADGVTSGQTVAGAMGMAATGRPSTEIGRRASTGSGATGSRALQD